MVVERVVGIYWRRLLFGSNLVLYQAGGAFLLVTKTYLYILAVPHWIAVAPGRLPPVFHALSPLSYTVFKVDFGIPVLLAIKERLEERPGYVLWNRRVHFDFDFFATASEAPSFNLEYGVFLLLRSSFSRLTFMEGLKPEKYLWGQLIWVVDGWMCLGCLFIY